MVRLVIYKNARVIIPVFPFSRRLSEVFFMKVYSYLGDESCQGVYSDSGVKKGDIGQVRMTFGEESVALTPTR